MSLQRRAQQAEENPNCRSGKGLTMTPKLKEFYEKGMDFIKEKKAAGSDPCTEIFPGTREWNAWGAYFRDEVGSFPAWFRELELRSRAGGQPKSFTVPAQWPWWVDTLNHPQPPIVDYRPNAKVRGRPAEDWDMMNANEAWRRKFAREHPVQAEKIFAGTAFDKFADGRFDYIKRDAAE